MDPTVEEIKNKLLQIGIKEPKAGELANNLVSNGFDELGLLNQLTEELLKKYGFRDGDILKFRAAYPPPLVMAENPLLKDFKEKAASKYDLYRRGAKEEELGRLLSDLGLPLKMSELIELRELLKEEGFFQQELALPSTAPPQSTGRYLLTPEPPPPARLLSVLDLAQMIGPFNYRPKIIGTKTPLQDGQILQNDNTIGNNFPFKNREGSRLMFFDNLLNDYYKWYNLRNTNTTNFQLADSKNSNNSNNNNNNNNTNDEPIRSIHFQVACGAGGIGKTTFATNVFLQEGKFPVHPDNKILRPLLNSMLDTPFGPLLFQCSFTRYPLSMSERMNPSGSIALRVLFSFLTGIGAVSPDKWTQFETVFLGQGYVLKLETVIEYIRAMCKYQPHEVVMMSIHLDETNHLFETSQTDYLKQTLLELAYEAAKNRNTFLSCTLTGTHATALFRLLTDSGSSFKAITLPLLSQKNLSEITSDFLKDTIGWTEKLPPFLEYAISCTGGNPRLLSILLMQASISNPIEMRFSVQKLKSLLQDCTENAVEALMDRTTFYLFHSYKNYFATEPHFKDVVASAVVYSLLGTPVTRESKLSTQSGTVYIGDLERDGFVYLDPHKNDNHSIVVQYYKLVVPLYHLKYYLERELVGAESVNNMPLIKNLSMRMSPRANEENDLNFVLWRIEATLILNQHNSQKPRSFRLKEAIPFWTGEDVELLYPSTWTFKRLPHIIDQTNFMQDLENDFAKDLENCAAFLNAQTGHFADSWIVLRKAANPSDLFILLIQSKQSVQSRRQVIKDREPETIPSKISVITEYLKSNVAVDHIFLYITDRKATRLDYEHVPPRVVLIAQSKLENFFGKLLSVRRLFSTLDS